MNIKNISEAIFRSPIYRSREVVTSVCYENDPFKDPRDIIITSRMAVSEVVIITNDHELPLAILLEKFITVAVVKMTIGVGSCCPKKISACSVLPGLR